MLHKLLLNLTSSYILYCWLLLWLLTSIPCAADSTTHMQLLLLLLLVTHNIIVTSTTWFCYSISLATTFKPVESSPHFLMKHVFLKLTHKRNHHTSSIFSLFKNLHFFVLKTQMIWGPAGLHPAGLLLVVCAESRVRCCASSIACSCAVHRVRCFAPSFTTGYMNLVIV